MGRVRRLISNYPSSVPIFGLPPNLLLQRIVNFGGYEQGYKTKSAKRRQRKRNRRIGDNNHTNITKVSNGKVSRQRLSRRVLKARDVNFSAEILNELKTDPDHYKVMRKRWQNFGIPNPAKNLTSLNLDGQYVEFHDEPKSEKIHHCTEFHDQKINELSKELRDKMTELHEKECQEVMLNVKKYADDLKNISTAKRISFSDLEKVLPLFESSVSQFEHTVDKFSVEMKALEDKMLPQIEKLKTAKEEINTFNSYYKRDGLNTMYMSKAEYNSLHDMDKWFTKMKEIYKS